MLCGVKYVCMKCALNVVNYRHKKKTLERSIQDRTIQSVKKDLASLV